MLPVIALVGRPNVGKSTLFNALTRTRDALVADLAGLTRDRQYGRGEVGPRPYLVVDTGGLTGQSDGLDGLVARQALQAVGEADRVLFLVDGRSGLTAADEEIALQLRRLNRAVTLVVNKAEHLDAAAVKADFYALGLGEPVPISATHRHGVADLMEGVLGELPEKAPLPEGEAALPAMEQEAEGAIRLAVVGRPNVGKSTLINRIMGEERVLAFDLPGTTRDAVYIPFERAGQPYTLIDTAGVRRRSRISETIEKFSVIKTLQAMEQCHVVIMVMDARQGIAEQDATLLGHVLDSGRALVLAVNKWDRLEPEVREQVRQDLRRKLNFLDFAQLHFISALHGSGVMDLFDSVRKAHEAASRKLSTPYLTRLLQQAMAAHQPPLVQGRSIKLRYAHQGGQNPPLIVIHGNRVEHIPESYRRYLINVFRQELDLAGTPVRVEFRSGDNPFKPTGRPARPQQHRPVKGRPRRKPGR